MDDRVRQSRIRQGLDPDRITDPVAIGKLVTLLRPPHLDSLTPEQRALVHALLDAQSADENS